MTGAELTLIGQQIRSLIALQTLTGTDDDTDPAPADPESMAERCRSVHFSCVALLSRNPSPREARLCSLFQVFASCYQEILLNAELQESGILPDDSRPLLQSVLDLLDQSTCALNEVCLGHPVDGAFRGDIRDLLVELRSQQAAEPESARWALTLERILLGVARLADCAESTSLHLQDTGPDNPFR